MKKIALGMVVKDRWELSFAALESLSNSNQSNLFDMYIIDNGSEPSVSKRLRDLVTTSTSLPIKNLLVAPELELPLAWNLFLSVTTEYPFRVKYDNDLMLPSSMPKISPPKSTPQVGGVNPGAVPSKVRIGMHHTPKKQKPEKKPPFLEDMANFSANHAVDVLSLVCVVPGMNFQRTFEDIARRSNNFVLGGCMMITKKCIETIGYFDERLSRRIDIDYSRRAMASGLNIGYHDQHYLVHNGHASPAKNPAVHTDEKIEQSSGYVNSVWEDAIKRVCLAMSNNTIINLK